MTIYVKVENNAVIGEPFTLAKDYLMPDGTLVVNVKNLTPDELINDLGVYPVVDLNSPLNYETVVVYTVFSDRVERQFQAEPLTEYQQRRIQEVYFQVAELLNNQTQGYSQSEIASWPLVQADIKQYNIDQTVGPYMQAVIDQGIHTAASLSALLTPRIQYEESVLINRAALVNQINAATTHEDVAAIDITQGW